MKKQPSLQPDIPPAWRAFGPEKEAWKREGNQFTLDELRKLEVDARELLLTACPDISLRAD